MAKTIDINGVPFKLVNRSTKNGESIYYTGLSKCNTYYYYDNIYKAYGKPSPSKIEIWEAWRRWFSEVEGTQKEMWVPSRNVYIFSIAFKYVNVEGYKVVGYITKTRNEVIMYAS